MSSSIRTGPYPCRINSHEKMDMKNVENEDKTIIYNLLHTLSKDGNTVVFSYKIFPKANFFDFVEN